jgi:hypothetical protein
MFGKGSMTQFSSSNEYAIEVPGRGYVVDTIPQLTLSQEPVCMPVRTDVSQALGNIKSRYIAMGCADIAETIRIITRTVTVTRGEWGTIEEKAPST